MQKLIEEIHKKVAWRVLEMKVYSPAKHHWGVGRGLRGPSVLFKPILEGERERGGGGRGESFTSCSPPSHKQSAEPQRSAGALVNKRPTYQWSGEGGAGMAFKRRLHGVWGAGAGEGPARCLYIQWRPGRTITNHKVQYGSNALKPELHITYGALCCTENRPDMSDCKWTIMMQMRWADAWLCWIKHRC